MRLAKSKTSGIINTADNQTAEKNLVIDKFGEKCITYLRIPIITHNATDSQRKLWAEVCDSSNL